MILKKNDILTKIVRITIIILAVVIIGISLFKGSNERALTPDLLKSPCGRCIHANSCDLINTEDECETEINEQTRSDGKSE